MNKTENERIRQTRVTHEAMQAVLDELEQVKRERDAAIHDLMYLAEGFCETGEVFECSICRNCDQCLQSSEPLDPCRLVWRGVCAENGGKV